MACGGPRTLRHAEARQPSRRHCRSGRRGGATKANYDLLMAGTRSEDIAMAEAKLAEARAKLEELDANLREAVVRRAGTNRHRVAVGSQRDLVTPNQPIILALRADDLWVKVYVPETDLGKVRLEEASMSPSMPTRIRFSREKSRRSPASVNSRHATCKVSMSGAFRSSASRFTFPIRKASSNPAWRPK